MGEKKNLMINPGFRSRDDIADTPDTLGAVPGFSPINFFGGAFASQAYFVCSQMPSAKHA